MGTREEWLKKWKAKYTLLNTGKSIYEYAYYQEYEFTDWVKRKCKLQNIMNNIL